MTAFSIESWSAWTPGQPSRDRMKKWLSDESTSLESLSGEAEPEVDAVSGRQLRRCSRITTMGLRTAFDCVDASSHAPDDVQLVWVTRHGEIGVTIDLLEDLANDEMLMPMSFSNSVPNTPAAYYDIAAKNTLTTRTICGGLESFHQGVIDALGLVQENPQHPVLLVQADGLLPEPLEDYNETSVVPFGIGMILGPSEDNRGLECRSEPLETNAGQNDVDEPPGLKVLRWYLSSSEETQIPGTRQRWIWSHRE